MSQETQTKSSKQLLLRTLNLVGPLLGLIIVTSLFASLDSFLGDGGFFTGDNMRNMALQTTVVAIAALGMTFIIIGGGIDLSAGTALALCATTLAWCLESDIGFTITHGTSIKQVSTELDNAINKLGEAEGAMRSDDSSPAAVANLLAAIDVLRDDSATEDAKSTARENLQKLVGDAPPNNYQAWTVYTYWSEKAGALREQLGGMLDDKLARASALAGPAMQAAKDAEVFELTKVPQSDPLKARIYNRYKHLEQSVASLETKKSKLTEYGFQPSQDRNWLKDIPNAASSPILAIAVGILTGVLAGLINGALISGLRVVPFIVTLGTMMIFLGAGNFISNNNPIRPGIKDQIPFFLQDLLTMFRPAQWFGLFPTGVWLLGLLAIISFVILTLTVFGRHVYALGSNEATARLCGISVPKTKILLYTFAGVFVGFAGVCQFAYVSIGNPTSGMGLELQIIAAVVIGGGSLSGGRGSILGTLAGAAIMAVIFSGCTQLGLGIASKQAILGAIIIGAVAVDRLREHKTG